MTRRGDSSVSVLRAMLNNVSHAAEPDGESQSAEG